MRLGRGSYFQPVLLQKKILRVSQASSYYFTVVPVPLPLSFPTKSTITHSFTEPSSPTLPIRHPQGQLVVVGLLAA